MTKQTSHIETPEQRNAAPTGRAYGRAIHLILVLYAVTFALFLPQAILVTDEAEYVQQAVLFASGHMTADHTDPTTGASVHGPLTTYPVGTSLLQVPFVWLGGWRWAAMASCLALFALVEFTRRLLIAEGRHPVFALLVFLFPAVLVLGRVAMSDVPSAAISTLALLLFWRGSTRGAAYYFASGFAAGLSLLFRETSVIVLIPFYVGALLRRERHVAWLIAGGVLGCVPRLVTGAIFFGSPIFARTLTGFSLDSFGYRFLFYLVGLFLLVPGSPLAVVAYRGPRRLEVLLSLLVTLAFFSTSSTVEASGILHRLVVAFRYLMPLLPILALAMGETIPRLWKGIAAQLPRHVIGERLAGRGLVALAVLGAVTVHLGLFWWSSEQSKIIQAIFQHTHDQSTIVTNDSATGKLILDFYGPRVVRRRDSVSPDMLNTLTPRPVQLVFLDRFDADFRQRDAGMNEQFVAHASSTCHLVQTYDQRYSTGERLRIWSVDRCPPTVGQSQ